MTIELTDQEAKDVIGALLFLSCVDVSAGFVSSTKLINLAEKFGNVAPDYICLDDSNEKMLEQEDIAKEIQKRFKIKQKLGK